MSPCPPCCRYEIDVADQVLVLDWPTADKAAPSPALAQAQALATALPWLQALEGWLDEPLGDVRPAAEAPWPTEDAALTLAVGPRPTARCAVPWAALPWGRAAPAALAVQWPRWRALLELDQLPALRLAQGSLATGALVLLPSSFLNKAAPGWAVRLQAGRPHGVPALTGLRWHPDEGRLDLASCRPAGGGRHLEGDGDPSHCPVHLLAPVSLCAGAWFANPPAEAQAAAGPVRLQLPTSTVTGELWPCGSGHGLRITAIEAHAACAV